MNKANIEKLWPIRSVFEKLWPIRSVFGVKKNPPCCRAINWEKGVSSFCQKQVSHET